MNHPVFAQQGILEHILGFAITLDDARPAIENSMELRRIKGTMAWLSSMRAVGRKWRDVVDDPSTKLWLITAQALQLEPPLKLYWGGTYKQVCQLLLEKRIEKARIHDAPLTQRRFSQCKGMIRSEGPQHPNPQRPLVKLPIELSGKVCKTTEALQSFLLSINFSVLSPEAGNHWCCNAIRRYRMFLYLKQQNPNIWLIPTVDIEFCWLAHIFRTESYWFDMGKLMVDPSHSLCLNSGEQAAFTEAVKATAALWRTSFGSRHPFLPRGFSLDGWVAAKRHVRAMQRERPWEEDFSFFPIMPPQDETIIDVTPQDDLPTISLTPEDIQADFKWFPQLSEGFMEIRSENKDSLYENHLLRSYERFLNLCHQENVKNVEPPTVLNLIWHAHQADPVLYKKDCLDLFDREFWHHPWPNGRSMSTELSESFRTTWTQMYGSTPEDDWQLILPESVAGS